MAIEAIAAAALIEPLIDIPIWQIAPYGLLFMSLPSLGVVVAIHLIRRRWGGGAARVLAPAPVSHQPDLANCEVDPRTTSEGSR